MPESEAETPMGGCLIRFFWLLVGPGSLIIAGLMLVVQRPRLGSPLDFVFAGIAAACIAARVLDPAKPEGAKSSGDLSQSSPKKYLLGVVVFAALVFAVAHFALPKAG